MPMTTKNFSDIITFTRTGSTATYFNAAGVLTTTVADEPRFDYDPSTFAAQGLLIEEARTNSIRNNTMQGAVAGTPGTLPTNWGLFASNGLTTSVVSTGVSGGINYIDLRINGTTTSTFYVFAFDTVAASASAGQTWTESFWCSFVSGSTSNITSVGVNLRQVGGAGNTFDSIFAPTSTLTRYASTGTLTASATGVYAALSMFFNSGVAIDITLRIGLPQLENNNISTGVASATVSAGGSGYAIGDVLQIVGGTGTAARLTVATLSGSAVATVTVSTAGSYSVFPSPQPVSVTAITGTGTSATFNIVPQTQAGFATSVIPTTTTALTRNADQASVNTLSPWYNSTAGTLYAEGVPNSPTGNAFNQVITSLDDTTNDNRIQIFRNASSGIPGALIATTGANQYTPSLGTWGQGVIAKTALAYQLNNNMFSVNGVNDAGGTGTIPTVTRLRIGARADGGIIWNGYLRRITYYPRRLSNVELQALTI